MDCTTAHSVLARDGFVRLEDLLTAEQVQVLCRESALLLSRPSQSWGEYVPFAAAGKWRRLLLAGEGRTTNCFDFIGTSPALDQTLEELLSNAQLRELLRRVLGNGFRLWYAQIRRVEPGAKALRMHQDQPGEVGLSILLSSTPTAAGTTVFWPGSQRWPRIMPSFPFLFPRHVRRFIQGAVGVPGDVYLFYNATWHGMASTDSVARVAIFLTFLPQAQARIERLPPPEVLAAVGPQLRRVMSVPASTNEPGDALSANVMGPDDVVGQRIPQPALISRWRIPILAAGLVGSALSVVRFARRGVRPH